MPAQTVVALPYAEIVTQIEAWREQYPRLVSVQSLGKTVEGRVIPLLRIGARRGTPEVALMAGIHPREQQPPVCLLRFLGELLDGYGKDARCTRILDTRTLWVVPLLNVDGKLYDDASTGKTPRDWRKNRRKNPDGTYGVDLNRNFAVRWGGFREVDPTWRVPTTQTSANIYEGSASLSEPESQALARFFATHPNLRAFLDIHSPLREILFPAYLPAHEAERFLRVAQQMQAAQKDKPYPMTQPKTDRDPPDAVRSGNTGLTYTHAFATQGIYGFNFEISIPSGRTGLEGRYPAREDILAEYNNNVREPLFVFAEQTGELPLSHRVRRTLRGRWTSDLPLTPGASVSLLPPSLPENLSHAILISEKPEIVVQSEYRRTPLASGFRVEVQATAKPGSKVPVTLYLWDKERRYSVHKTLLAIAPRV